MKAEKTPEEIEALDEFNKITEAASALMDVGEMDIYSAVREELQRAADAFKNDDDMFADADEDNAKVSCTSFPARMAEALILWSFHQHILQANASVQEHPPYTGIGCQ